MRPYHADMTRLRWSAYLVTAAAIAVDLLCWVWTLNWLGDEWAMYLAIGTLLVAPVIVLGVLVATRRPDNPVGLLLTLAGSVPLVVVLLPLIAAEVYVEAPGALPVSALLVAAQQGAWMWLYVPGALLMLVFPDGRLLSQRWRWIAGGLLVVPIVFMVPALPEGALPAPYEVVSREAVPEPPEWVGVVGLALLPTFLVLLVSSAVSMVLRRRRSTDPTVRAQLRWFGLGALFLPGALLLCWLSYLLFDTADLGFLVIALTPLALAAATAVALLRHDLYDVDRALSNAVTYTLLSAVLLAIFTVVDVGIGLLLGQGSAPAAAIATAVGALALMPVRSRLQGVVARRIDPQRSAAISAVTDLRARIDAGSAQPEELEGVLRGTLADPGLRVGFRVPGRAGYVDIRGERVEIGRGAPVELGTDAVGVLVPDSGTASKELLREVAGEIAWLVEVIRLRHELADAVQQVGESRQRLLHAGYEERRRLQRDLHDGAQQRLVSLGMALRLAQRHLGPGNEELVGLLDQAVAELGTSVAELRALSHGLRPTTVGGGLAPALRALATAVPIAVDLDLNCDDVPEEVATTAYYVASEALANTVKHSRAGYVEIVAQRSDGALDVSVRDDGQGGADLLQGSGLRGLADRVEAAGGRLQVESSQAQGTTVRAVIPCA